MSVDWSFNYIDSISNHKLNTLGLLTIAKLKIKINIFLIFYLHYLFEILRIKNIVTLLYEKGLKEINKRLWKVDIFI